ncbi:acyltransferase family protein [Hymenobacter jeollabukensis]|uniref:DUF1624 domain-containing protein n=1 Tax=Hymenobacter jeollabukensis TaxID=2025313 RepID=A0A5R8WMC4_9BACT|nr:heparan-alpha-glucosaminide N-acetyltransferase domain-containing protein [Hymenobacter jeollabukensis]TLM90108.1 DUF1624 domain-containing protein [Hymenobacter jeollabukensis]
MQALDEAARATTHTTPVAEASGPGRLVSLDAFRGLTVIVMLLVNFPGAFPYYVPLSHIEWHGCRPADLVFPFFLFIVGVSLAFALDRARHDPAQQRRVLLTVLRRTLILIALGMLIDLTPKFYFTSFRIMGVLQRIGLVFLACSLLFLKTRWRTQLGLFALILIGYNLVLQLVPVPGVGPANLERLSNLGTWLDRLVLTQRHLYDEFYSFEPEGILSTFPSICTGLLGVFAGRWLRRTDLDAATRVAWLFAASLLCLVLGIVWNGWFPINKQLWTSSFVLYSGGIAGALLATLYWLLDVQQWRRGLTPLLVFGTNAITIYFLSELVDKLLSSYDVAMPGGGTDTVRNWLFQTQVLPHFANPQHAALFYALDYTAVWGLLAWELYRRRIFIKI